MIRTKFRNAQAPDYHEQIFIERMERYKSIKKDTLALFIFGYVPDSQTKSRHRQVRKYIERYNNYRYKNIIPLGKIITHNGSYELIRSESPLANKIRLKAKYDLIASAINYHNTRKALGDTQHDDQIDIYAELGMSLSELMDYANTIDSEINVEE